MFGYPTDLSCAKIVQYPSQLNACSDMIVTLGDCLYIKIHTRFRANDVTVIYPLINVVL